MDDIAHPLDFVASFGEKFDVIVEEVSRPLINANVSTVACFSSIACTDGCGSTVLCLSTISCQFS